MDSKYTCERNKQLQYSIYFLNQQKENFELTNQYDNNIIESYTRDKYGHCTRSKQNKYRYQAVTELQNMIRDRSFTF